MPDITIYIHQAKNIHMHLCARTHTQRSDWHLKVWDFISYIYRWKWMKIINVTFICHLYNWMKQCHNSASLLMQLYSAAHREAADRQPWGNCVSRDEDGQEAWHSHGGCIQWGWCGLPACCHGDVLFIHSYISMTPSLLYPVLKLWIHCFTIRSRYRCIPLSIACLLKVKLICHS